MFPLVLGALPSSRARTCACISEIDFGSIQLGKGKRSESSRAISTDDKIL